MSDGSLYLVFNFFPPSDLSDDEDPSVYDNFDEQLQKALDVEVLWEDREFFLIRTPEQDTIDKLKSFIKKYRSS